MTLTPVVWEDHRDLLPVLEQEPDVALTFPSLIGLHADIGLWADLNKVLSRKVLGGYLPGALQACSIGESLMAIPIAASGTVVYYNVESLRKAGVPLPTKAWTWAGQFLAACKKLTRDTNGDGAKESFGLLGPPGTSWAGMVYGYGGNVVDTAGGRVGFASPASLEAARLAVQLQREGLVEGVRFDLLKLVAELEHGLEQQ